MNLKQLEYFVHVAELGSFSRAALILNIAQPALSRQVRLLETDLHVTLLMRNGRGVVLTEAGKRLFDHSVGILQLVSHVREDIQANRNEPAGRIVVGLPPSMGRLLTLPLVEGIRRTLPKARLAVVEGLSNYLSEWISTGRIDLGLLHNPEPQAALDLTPLLDEPLGLVSPADRSARKGATVAFADLIRYPLIVPERTHAIRKLLETQAALAGHKLNVVLELSSVHSILELVGAGFGHAVLAPAALEAFGQPEAFLWRPLVEPRVTSPMCLAISAHKPATPLGKQVFGLLRELVLAGPGAALAAHNKTR